MPTYRLTQPNLTALLDRVAGDRQVLKSVPVRDTDQYTYRIHRPGEPFEYAGFRASPSLKGVLFPIREKMGTFPAESTEAPELAPVPMVVGAAACDLKALASLDAVFLEQDFVDPFYQQRRDALRVISQDCTDPRPSCACTYLGFKPYPEEGYDLNLSQVEGEYLAETGGAHGERLVEEHRDLFQEATDAQLAQREDKRQAAVRAVEDLNREYELPTTRQELLRREHTDEQWHEAVDTCVECAACLFTCPTCHCFLLADQPAGAGAERWRVWDACSYAGYGRMAGGGTPRPALVERFRHRYAHKFDYFVDRYGFEMCSGCGRCIEGCAGKIDMREVFRSLASARV